MRVSKKMARLNIEIPQELHRKIKAAASLQGKTLKDYVIARVLPGGEAFDTDDVNTGLAQGLAEVARHQAGNVRLPTYQEFITQKK